MVFSFFYSYVIILRPNIGLLYLYCFIITYIITCVRTTTCTNNDLLNFTAGSLITILQVHNMHNFKYYTTPMIKPIIAATVIILSVMNNIIIRH